ncbi:MAG TPA: XdhC family protein, partial [Phycisphaerae bacterium]|nr:XdhC family protein [Phycisphaerae bacterium]
AGAVLPYVGVIGSEAKAGVLRRGVLAAGIPEERLGLYHCPIGLPLGTNDPAEIAVSVAAQLLQCRDARARGGAGPGAGGLPGGGTG